MIIGLLGLVLWLSIVGYITTAFEDRCPICDSHGLYKLSSIAYECSNCGNVFNKK
tara:strand:- start:43 stop:207 length:165 start_codon:yes stop_codon:yes gene_type:complete